MPYAKLKHPDELWEERRKRVENSLRVISLEELLMTLRQHEEEFVGNPWRDEFLRLMQERPQPTFYQAIAQDDVMIYYCREADFGVWVVPNSGIGPLDETSKRITKEVIAKSCFARS